MSQTHLSEEQLEIVGLLTGEIKTLSETECPRVKSLAGEALADLLFELHVQIDHISNALDMAGLSALSSCGKWLADNFKRLSSDTSLVQTPQKEAVEQWGPLFLSYLNTLGQDSEEGQHALSLIQLLENGAWPAPLNDEDKQGITELFDISGADTLLGEEGDSLPESITPEMCSLAPEDNIRPELLQGLLIELPQQVEQFESSLKAFLGSHDFTDLNQAQRIAHTIKGAANVVSVSGLANLMHFTEDLLESATKKWQTPPEGFVDFLQNVADCLAISAEYLNKMGPAPDDIESTMSGLLQWLRYTKNGDAALEQKAPLTDISVEDAPANIDTQTAASETPVTQASSPKQAGKATPEDDEVRYINLPSQIAQELLRLSGETQISNNQFGARVENLQDSVKLSDNYHKQIQTMAIEFESLVQTQSALRSAALSSKDDQFDPLEMEQFNELHSFSHQLLELTTDSYESVASIESQLDELSALLYAQKQLNRDNQQILLDMNLLPVETFSSRFSRCVRQACRLTNKSATLEIDGANVMMDSHVLNAIADPLMHVLRNAVDHGLEGSRYEREQLGKPAEGKITLSFMNKGETISVECSDDGHGLDYDAIYQTALAKELISDDANYSPQLLNQMVLLPGFSTRREATQTSGRGIGLDAVMASVRALKGNMQITSEKNKGCKISITVPSSILTAHAIVIKAQYRNEQQSYSLLGRAVEQIIYVRPEQIESSSEGHRYQLHDEVLPIYLINDLLGFGIGDIEKTHALLLCRKADNSHVLVAVEQIIASQELVVKSLNDFTYIPPGVVGATIMGDGSVSPVVDLQELPGLTLEHTELTQLGRRREQLAALEKAQYKEPPAALVVDDSLSARRSLAQFVSDMGMEVTTAKDGFDAISAIERKKPSLLLVDLEMPRMNGLELTAHLRSRAEYKDIPVIMITSRSTDRHKTLAESAGVDTYLTKPWSEDELMQCIEKQIA
ncbi:MAG: response regulator [Agarilytica sp.]